MQKGIQGKKAPVAHMTHKLNRDKLCYILERKTGVGKTKIDLDLENKLFFTRLSNLYFLLHKGEVSG